MLIMIFFFFIMDYDVYYACIATYDHWFVIEIKEVVGQWALNNLDYSLSVKCYQVGIDDV